MLQDQVIFTWTTVRDGSPRGYDRSVIAPAPPQWKYLRTPEIIRYTEADGVPIGHYHHVKEVNGMWVYRRDSTIYTRA